MRLRSRRWCLASRIRRITRLAGRWKSRTNHETDDGPVSKREPRRGKGFVHPRVLALANEEFAHQSLPLVNLLLEFFGRVFAFEVKLLELLLQRANIVAW